MSIVLAWIPCPSLDCAERIGKAAVEHHLAACANILPGMRSIYRWEGEIRSEDEVLLALKTVADHVDALVELVVSLHPYDLPAVSVIPVAGGHLPFLAWVRQETSE